MKNFAKDGINVGDYQRIIDLLDDASSDLNRLIQIDDYNGPICNNVINIIEETKSYIIEREVTCTGC